MMGLDEVKQRLEQFEEDFRRRSSDLLMRDQLRMTDELRAIIKILESAMDDSPESTMDPTDPQAERTEILAGVAMVPVQEYERLCDLEEQHQARSLRFERQLAGARTDLQCLRSLVAEKTRDLQQWRERALAAEEAAEKLGKEYRASHIVAMQSEVHLRQAKTEIEGLKRLLAGGAPNGTDSGCSYDVGDRLNVLVGRVNRLEVRIDGLQRDLFAKAAAQPVEAAT
jgi:hypothetical protein